MSKIYCGCIKIKYYNKERNEKCPIYSTFDLFLREKILIGKLESGVPPPWTQLRSFSPDWHDVVVVLHPPLQLEHRHVEVGLPGAVLGVAGHRGDADLHRLVVVAGGGQVSVAKANPKSGEKSSKFYWRKCFV